MNHEQVDDPKEQVIATNLREFGKYLYNKLKNFTKLVIKHSIFMLSESFSLVCTHQFIDF